MTEIRVEGRDGDKTEVLPPLELRYTAFEPEGRRYQPLTAVGGSVPDCSLDNPDYELVDLFGNGLPDVIQMNGTVRYWRNLGDGRFDALLEDDQLFQIVKADLCRRSPRTPIDGRPSTPAEVILRMLVVKHLYGWSYAQTEHWVSDSLVLRHFCRVYLEPVPDDTTLIRWANAIQPATLHRLLDQVVDLARQLRVTRGRKLRIDSTVVETDIHFPVDSTLLGDGVRILNRAIQRARQRVQPVGEHAQASFRDRTRSVRKVMRRLIAASRQRGSGRRPSFGVTIGGSSS